ncbi:MAG: uracil-DNA glycosylase family protein [Planctomycetota bacterium]
MAGVRRSLKVIREARACTACSNHLPLGARPLLSGSGVSRLLIIGQAPGVRAHESGVPWDDASGERLRAWLGVSAEEFYDESKIALMPMGFCYPGKGKSGDLPPRAECAPLWHERLLKAFKKIQLTVIVGRYACEQYLQGQYATLGEAVGDWERLLPGQIVLPHPSGRNNIWLKKNDWFEKEVLASLQDRVKRTLG